MDRKIAVLIVDDEPLVREVSVAQLEDAGYEVLEAASADEAICVLESGQSVGVVFTDVHMPGALDGLDLARLVHQRWPAIKLIVTSGRAELCQADIPAEGRLILKPYSLSQMSELVDELVAR
jgi:two-component system, response regulator PdtaR